VAILPAGWAAGQGLGLEYTTSDRARQRIGRDRAELREVVDRVG
jgi:hypothetical protein